MNDYKYKGTNPVRWSGLQFLVCGLESAVRHDGGTL